MSSRPAAPPNPTRAPGHTLPALARLEAYEIQGVLARSSFAVVYRAYDPALKQQVAIKEYLPEALALRNDEPRVVPRAPAYAEAFEQGLQAFVGEAELLARCDHPALLRVLRLIRANGTAYRVMRFSPYPTLLEQRQRQAAAPAASTLRAWLDDLLGALQTLHAEGCVHGAVAPGHILLQPDARPLLLDLDAVRGVLVSDRTQSMMAALEPCFEPIEQRAPVSYMVLGPWTDLYALAATLHFCISGQVPSPPHAPSATPAFEALGAVWQRLRTAQPALGTEPEWLHVLDACLRESPQDRPQSVAQVRALLDPRPAAVLSAAPTSAARAALTLVPAADADAGAAAAPASAMAPGPASDPARAPGVVAGEFAAVAVAAAGATANADAAADPAADGAADGAAAIAGADGAAADADADPAAAAVAAAPDHSRLEPAAAPTAAPIEPAARQPVVAVPTGRRWLRPVGATTLLAAAAVLVVVVWAVKKTNDAEGPAGAQAANVVASPMRSSPEPMSASLPVSVPAAATPPPPHPAEEAQAASAPAAAVVAEEAAPVVRATPSPRERCAGRERYALWQCMQAQCAKKSLAKHEQCRRLRDDNSLS